MTKFIRQITKPVVVDTKQWVEDGNNIEEFPALKQYPNLFELVENEELPSEFDTLNYQVLEEPIGT